jgi:ribosomal protein S18 acetylase RimI-like enzyme
VIVERASEASGELVAAFARLVPQLTTRTAPPSAAEIERVLADPRAVQLVARDGGAIVGVLTLLVFELPTGLKARIEDVIVDEHARGQGAGEALVAEAQRLADESGVVAIELTTAPQREAANRLYARLGFVRRETNVYVWCPH